MTSSFNDRIFYHIYPLGMCGAPKTNDYSSPAGNGLLRLIERIPHLASLGVDAVYLGPLFESTAHGYDTVDYWHVDRRLGTNDDLARLVRAFHDQGIAVILDAVFNHTGRDFFAFKDIRARGASSEFRDWYRNVDFGKRSPMGDSFSYEGWSGCHDLAKLDTSNRAVREYLFGAVRHWVDDFGIDGLRLDAADVLAPDFMTELASFCRTLKSEFWLMGEVVHGDYRNWACEGRLDSVTNYELYKGLWSSFNDHNFFELAWSLNRQFGPEGIYRAFVPYNFSENHDVNRVASVLKNQSNIFSLYGLLFTVPGIPSVYYGGEWGLRGEKRNGSDDELRPPVHETSEHGRLCGAPAACAPSVDSAMLENLIRSLANLRKEHAALRRGSYRQLHVSHDQFVFSRTLDGETILIAVNAAPAQARIHLADFANGTHCAELFRFPYEASPHGANQVCGFHGLDLDLPVGGMCVLSVSQ